MAIDRYRHESLDLLQRQFLAASARDWRDRTEPPSAPTDSTTAIEDLPPGPRATALLDLLIRTVEPAGMDGLEDRLTAFLDGPASPERTERVRADLVRFSDAGREDIERQVLKVRAGPAPDPAIRSCNTTDSARKA